MIKKTIKYISASILILILIETGTLLWQYNRAIIIISNNTGENISELKILMRDGDIDIGILRGGENIKTRVFPHGESDFTISFKTPDGKTLTANGTYIESKGGYIVRLKIWPDWSVTREEDMLRGFIFIPILKCYHNYNRSQHTSKT